MSPAFVKTGSLHCCVTATINSSPGLQLLLCGSLAHIFNSKNYSLQQGHPSDIHQWSPGWPLLGCSNKQGLALPDETFLYHNGLLIKLSLSLGFNDSNLPMKEEKKTPVFTRCRSWLDTGLWMEMSSIALGKKWWSFSVDLLLAILSVS